MTKWLLVLLPLLLAATPGGAMAEEETRDAGLEAMKTLPPLAGRWEGGGWIRQGAEPERFVGEERVEPRLDGRLLVVEGKHWAPDRSRVVHHAFAVLSYDPAKKSYRFQTHLANGRGGDFSGSLEDGAFVWEMESPAGRIRYVIRIEGDRWLEVGKIERGGQWHQFLEMDLKRVGS